MKLRNGSVEFGPLVVATMATLDDLLTGHPDVFAEAVRMARDPSHRPDVWAAESLKRSAILDASGKMRESIRNVILSAVRGEGEDVGLCDPFA